MLISRVFLLHHIGDQVGYPDEIRILRVLPDRIYTRTPNTTLPLFLTLSLTLSWAFRASFLRP